MGAGRHTVQASGDTLLSLGNCFVRLAQGNAVASARMTMLN